MIQYLVRVLGFDTFFKIICCFSLIVVTLCLVSLYSTEQKEVEEKGVVYIGEDGNDYEFETWDLFIQWLIQTKKAKNENN